MAITDPTLEKKNTIIGYIYLFEVSTNVSNQDAGQKLVNYDFNLLSGEYLDNYKFTCDNFLNGTEELLSEGPIHQCSDEVMNPEDSLVKTQHFERHHSENW